MRENQRSSTGGFKGEAWLYKRATPVEWLTLELISLEEEIRNLKSK